MNQSEFNAMIGVDEGAQAVPTLDDYTVALETLRQRERITAPSPATLGSWADGLTNANHPQGLMQSLLGQQSRIESNQQAFAQNLAPAVKLCAECRWATNGECRSPSQKDYADRAGSASFHMVSVIRNVYCHGDWWEHGKMSASERDALRSREMARRG